MHHHTFQVALTYAFVYLQVFTHETYRSKIAAYCRLYENNSVVEINEIIQGDKFVYVFFDKHYGDLHSYVRSKRRLKEEEAVNLFRQIAEAVAQCHQCGVVIRDLKLRKFVFTNPERYVGFDNQNSICTIHFVTLAWVQICQYLQTGFQF